MIAALDEDEADLASGLFRDYTVEQTPTLVEELKREARALRDQRNR